MDKKSTQRIIGVLVIVAFAIILLPLLFGGNNASQSPQTAEAKTQTTAESAVTPVTSPEPQSVAEVDTSKAPIQLPEPVNSPAQEIVKADKSAVLPNPTPAVTVEDFNQKNNQPSEHAVSIAPAAAASASDEGLSVPAVKLDDANFASQQSSETPTVSDAPKVIAVKSAVKALSVKSHTHAHVAVHELKNAAWVVQLGAFKNKSNAQHLVNKLRAEGFKAFTHEVGSTLRVYVGPTADRPAARSLVAQLQHKTTLQGIVLFYNPMEL